MEDEKITISSINNANYKDMAISDIPDDLDPQELAILFKQARKSNQEISDETIIDAASHVWGKKSQDGEINQLKR